MGFLTPIHKDLRILRLVKQPIIIEAVNGITGEWGFEDVIYKDEVVWYSAIQDLIKTWYPCYHSFHHSDHNYMLPRA